MSTPDPLHEAVLDILISRGYEQKGRITVGARALARLNAAYLAAAPHPPQ